MIRLVLGAMRSTELRALLLMAVLSTLVASTIDEGSAATPQDSPSAAAEQARFPWKAGDPPPLFAGIRLGDSRDAVERTLGKPAAMDQLGEDEWQLTYDKLGIEVQGSAAKGVVALLAGDRAAGDLGGFRVGDFAGDVQKRWGEPDTGGLGAMVYYAGPWQLAVQEDVQGRIVVLGLALRPDYEPPSPEPALPPAAALPAASVRLPPVKTIAVGQTFDLPPGTLQVFNAQYVGQVRDDDEVSIRIAGIVAPVPQLPGSQQAQARLEELLKDRPVRIEITNVAKVETLRLPTGRVLVGGEDIAPVLIREGWALGCRKQCEDPSLLALEAEARAGMRGLWGLTDELSGGSPEDMMGFLLYGCQCSKKR